MANLPSLPDFDSVQEIAAAACQSSSKNSIFEEGVDEKILVVTVKVLFGDVLEESETLEELREAANNFGLSPIAKNEEDDQTDLLGVEEFQFVRCAASVPVVESLI